jgi:hypothetical protein
MTKLRGYWQAWLRHRRSKRKFPFRESAGTRAMVPLSNPGCSDAVAIGEAAARRATFAIERAFGGLAEAPEGDENLRCGNWSIGMA